MLEQTRINKNRLYFPLIVILAWTVFGLFFGAQNYVRDVYVGKGASLPGYIVGWLLCGYSWAILTVPVLRFTRRFSLESQGWSRFFLIHLPAAVFFALLQLGIYVTIAGFLFGNARSGMWEFYKSIAVKEFQSSFLVYFVIISAVTAYDRLFRAESSVSAVDPDKISSEDREQTKVRSNGQSQTWLRRIPVKENGRIRVVEVKNIEWIESYGNYVFLHTPERRYIYRETMAAMEERLDPERFVRIRRSTIVKVDRIAELRPAINGEFEVVLANGKVLAASRRYRKNIESIVRA